MLVLTRHPSEGITITTPQGDTIHVVLVKQRGDKSHIGIDAPQDHRIVRDELLDQPKEPTT